LSTDLFISTASGGRDKQTVDFLNQLFLYAATQGISDIHFEAAARDWNIRIRRQGELEEIQRVRNEIGMEINLKIRSKSKMELADRGAPLDGRFSLVYEGEGVAVDVRVSIVPTERGSTIVCRVLDQKNATRDFEEINMTAEVRECVRTLIEEPNGLFLVTGPTGSGKTSTLYSIIGELNTPTRKILTIEDPVEYQVDGLQQIPITQNNSFPDALRAALRQDPDIILVGEIRDAETAKIAVSAASTGHLVLSTLHTNDASSSIMRMMDLGVDAFTLGSCLKGVLAQRLVVGINGEKQFVPPSLHEKIWLSSHGIEDLESPVALPVSEGGMGGRVPVMELIMVDRDVKTAMAMGDVKAVKAAARKQRQYMSLPEAGAFLSRRGMTTLAQVRNIASNIDVESGRRKIGEILVQEGRITQRQLDRALEIQIDLKTKGTSKLLGEILISMGVCSIEDVNDCISLQSA
jgi:general secretion pathway protein E